MIYAKLISGTYKVTATIIIKQINSLLDHIVLIVTNEDIRKHWLKDGCDKLPVLAQQMLH